MTDGSEMLRPFKTLSRRTILKHNKFLMVESHTVEWPGGRVVSDWPWIVGPDASIVVAVTIDHLFLCFRQVKYAINGTCLAPVGGILEPGEMPEDAAKRELLEETGYQAEVWTSLGSYHVDPNRGAGVSHLFLAEGARLVSEPIADDIEDQHLLLLTHSEIQCALDAGEFKALCWVAAMALALRHLEKTWGC